MLNFKISYEVDEDIVLIRFIFLENLYVVEFKRIDEGVLLDNLIIFFIVMFILIVYLNFVINFVFIMGVYDNCIVYGINLNFGIFGLLFYLKLMGEFIGINVKYLFIVGGCFEVLINEVIYINRVIDFVEGYL